MKKFFEQPVVNVVRFEAKDVITTSSSDCGIKAGAPEKGNYSSTARIAESKSFGGGVSFSAAW